MEQGEVVETAAAFMVPDNEKKEELYPVNPRVCLNQRSCAVFVCLVVAAAAVKAVLLGGTRPIPIPVPAQNQTQGPADDPTLVPTQGPLLVPGAPAPSVQV